MPPGRAYLSIVEWPSAWSPDRCVETLVAAAGMDPGHAKLAVARGVPQVVGLYDLAVRDEILAALRDDGVLACAPTRDEMDAWRNTLRVKRLFLFPDRSAIGVEPWRGDHLVVQAAHVRLIVHGSDRVSKTTIRPAENILTTEQLGRAGAGWSDDLDLTNLPISRDVKTTIAELIDVYAADGDRVVRLRVDADKMNFDILGKVRAMTDRDNTRILANLLGKVCRGATLDRGFDAFVLPPAVLGVRGASDRTGAFDFYSVWLAMLYQSMGAL